MNILVTGGAGFIGSHTVIALSEAGFTPIIIDDFSNSNQRVIAGLEKILGKKPRLYTENCHNAAVLRQIIREEKIEGVIHFAAFKSVGESQMEPLKYYNNNLGSLLTLMQVMLECGVPNLIFSSSATVYRAGPASGHRRHPYPAGRIGLRQHQTNRRRDHPRYCGCRQAH